jgi:NuA3 HAT complex component NTO1
VVFCYSGPAADVPEPIETELAVQVEYDMDEQGMSVPDLSPLSKLTRADQAWLEAINAERKKDQSGAISYEVFEVIMDKLEKEWFNLVCPSAEAVAYVQIKS